jgi:hypothetical protein
MDATSARGALRILTLPFVVAGLTLGTAEVRAASDEGLAEFFMQSSLPVPTVRNFVACYGFGCKFRVDIVLGPGDRARLAGILAAGRASPEKERRAAALAVVWLDKRIGPIAKTTKRAAYAGPNQANDSKGHMDCIDLSNNNTALFMILARLKLLRHHRVELPVSRGMVLDMRWPHVTAVLGEIKTGKKWALDNWPQKYGETPKVKPLDQWRTDRI